MKNTFKILFLAVLLLATGTLHAEKYRGAVAVTKGAQTRAASTCLPATNSNELTVNNVRAYLETNGTMWFEEIAQYEVPYGSGKTSMFAAALWIGGKDVNDQLKLAAVRFRQRGDDFWTGPLTLNGASVTQETCAAYDKHFKITRAEVEAHKANWQNSDYVMPNSIREWPAHPYDLSAGQSYYLAPFFDADGDGDYNPENGDYPYYDLDNELCPWTEANRALAAADQLPKTPEERMGISKGMVYADHVLKGDATLFWIFNDKGGPHTESQGEAIGLEIRAQAFGFSTNDELNNMTFYSYEIINRSTFDLTNTFFSQWVDPDLGWADDDYVGCDVARGLGYCYNGRNIDGQGLAQHYGAQPPAVGVDFFQGPYLDPDGYDNPSFNGKAEYGPSMLGSCDIVTNNGQLGSFSWVVDPDSENPTTVSDSMILIRAEAINGVNFGDGIVDNERFGMRRFVYHNNDNSVVGDPDVAFEYYNMLRGLWKDNLKMKYGHNAHPQNGATGPDCDFMFPGLSDPCNWGTMGVDPQISQYGADGWTEVAAGNAPADRRFMQSAGPFTLKAGAVNYITVGIPWARAASGGAQASVDALKVADDKCQSLFENCFKVLDGPDAPTVTIEEMENQLILYLTNLETSNNYNEGYEETDPSIPTEMIHESISAELDTIWCTIEGIDTFVLQSHDISTFDTMELDNKYRFEGYMIYQCSGPDVSVTDIGDLNKVRLIAQCDIQNEASQLVNWKYNDAIGTSAPQLMVDGENLGIRHSFVVTEDKFATTSPQLINHKKYYFFVLAYGYNNYWPFSIETGSDNGLLGQKVTFLAGRRNIGDQTNSGNPYVGIPHSPTPENGGSIVNSEYGTQPMITRIEGQGNGGFFLDLTEECRDQILRNGTVNNITYKNNAGPINVRVINPLKIQPNDYIVRFVHEDTVNTDVTSEDTWVLQVVDENGDVMIDEDGFAMEVESQSTISINNEQLIPEYGISLTILNYPFAIHNSDLKAYVDAHGYTYKNVSSYSQVDFLGSELTYADESKPWLSGVVDADGDLPSNWIRSGVQEAGPWDEAGGTQDGVEDEYFKWKTEDFFQVVSANEHVTASSWSFRAWKDPDAQFEKVIDGTWAPYVLSSPYYGGPQAKFTRPDVGGYGGEQPKYQPGGGPSDNPTDFGWSYYHFPTMGTQRWSPGFNQTMTNLYSVDIVLTPDKDKWTRCIVLEACDDPTKSEGGALCHEPRKHASVDKNGNPDGTGEGMGWFPGYAINVETGERLNIMFAENSADPENNGNDMIFNPTNVYARSLENPEEVIYQTQYDYMFANQPQYYGDRFGNPCFGGKHFVYIVGSTGNTNSVYYRNNSIQRNFDTEFDCGPYDEGQWLMNKFNSFVNLPESRDLNNSQMKNRTNRKMQLFNNVMWTSIPMPAFQHEDEWLSNDATIKIRVSRPYMRYSAGVDHGPEVAQNDNYPMYSFTTKNIAIQSNQETTHQSILDNINIVPNPYYGYSTYESTALETYAKIVNLPTYEDGAKSVTISIYTVNGILVRKLTKGDASTFVDWDLKNSANIPIASGVYIIHVDAPGIGERTLKFFAGMRPTDLNAF
ncbi:MAG: hypothetical protein MJZ49_00395 [Bacteroidales bacterium]|nr:hypothetical protein [Bacteroidales bacterium]